MRCETCLGTGKLLSQEAPEVPCFTCGGTGFDHCCSGEVCNGLDETEADKARRAAALRAARG
jgi:hypothetical protein